MLFEMLVWHARVGTGASAVPPSAARRSLSRGGKLKLPSGVRTEGRTTDDNHHPNGGYCDVWKSMFSSTESCSGVPEASSPDRVATTRKPLALV
jgi:hypothetical protein